ADRDANRPPGLLHHLHVLLWQVTAFVEDGEAHDVELHVDVPHLLGLEDPPRRDPAPGTEGIEPEVDAVTGHGESFLRGWTGPGGWAGLRPVGAGGNPGTTSINPEGGQTFLLHLDSRDAG